MANAVAGSGNWVRILGWGAAVALLAAPFVAMRFTSEVNWTASDFIVAGLMFATVGGLFEFGVRVSSNGFYRAGFAAGLLGIFLVIWTNLAVGIVGSNDNPGTQWFFAALLIGIVGAAIARLRPMGMALAMSATAVSIGAAFVVAIMAPTDEPFVSHWTEGFGTSIFALLFLGSAALFRRSA
jgi:hypothetical protein